MTVRDLAVRDIVEALDLDAIQEQRWFRHKGQVRGPASLLDGWPVRNLGNVAGWWLIVGIPVETGEAAYQIPVFIAPESPDGGAFGRIQSNGQLVWICDGSASSVIMADLVARMRHNRIAPLERGRVVAQVFSFPTRFPSEFSPLNVDSSNTLIGLDRTLLLKVYRCLDRAGTREVRLMRMLSNTGTDAVPVLSAALEYQRGGEPVGAMAMIQEWLFDADDAWKWVTDRLKSGPADIDEDVQGMALAIAEMHRSLIGLVDEDREARWKPEDTDTLKSSIRSRLAQLDEWYSEEMPGLRELIAHADAAVDGIHAADDGPVCEVHGDLHLGQFLRHEWHFGVTKYRLIDFEGEPLAASEDRAARHSPMKDVAGMLRSFDYAAGFARKNGALGSDDDWARWSQRAESAFLSTYGDAMHMPELTGSATENGLLMLHVIEKAVYEIAYELSARPDWVEIPMGGLRRILDRLSA